MDTVARIRPAIDEFHRLYHAGEYLSIYDSSDPMLAFLIEGGETALHGTAAPSALPSRPGYVNAYHY
jgi:hypothetical protein